MQPSGGPKKFLQSTSCETWNQLTSVVEATTVNGFKQRYDSLKRAVSTLRSYARHPTSTRINGTPQKAEHCTI